MIDDGAAAAARAAAQELATKYGSRLVVDVEARIHADGERRASRQFVDPVAVGALIVAIAQFGYQVYTDRKSKGQRPARETIAQAIRIERREHGDLSDTETEIIEIVSAKIVGD